MKGVSVHAAYIGAITLLVVINFMKLPFISFLFLCGVAIVLYGFTNSCPVAILTLLAPFFLQAFNYSMGSKSSKPTVIAAPARGGPPNAPVPSDIEGFESPKRDPVSIHQRLETVKHAAPKKHEPTGVLDSPEILDNTPLLLEGMEGEPGVATPASVKSRNLIYPPSEDSIPSSGESRDMPPMPNPYLQNGQDSVGVSVALSPTGTKLPPIDTPAGEMAGTMTGTMGSNA